MVVHYAGVACDMDRIMEIARKHHLIVIEDAAQAIESTYKGKQLGTIGDFGCLSFHDTKNITCGEGGALFINNNDPEIFEQAEIIREKGTNRSKFFRGLVDKYTWVDIGGSYLPSDLLAAFLYAQLNTIDMITRLRMKKYTYYLSKLQQYARSGYFTLPTITLQSTHNAHIFYVILPNQTIRNAVLDSLKSHGIGATFHYIPLHNSPQGLKLGNKKDSLPHTDDISGRLLRLPLFSLITKKQQDIVITTFLRTLSNTIKDLS
jgi:dTDP-4-amino-4,6-dideoxygalactose transaminase